MSPISCSVASKWALNGQNYSYRPLKTPTSTVWFNSSMPYSMWGHSGPFGWEKGENGHLIGSKRPQMVPNGPKWSQMVPNGPKWSQMVPKGPHQYSMVMLCPTIHDLGPFRPFSIAKKMRNRLKIGPH